MQLRSRDRSFDQQVELFRECHRVRAFDFAAKTSQVRTHHLSMRPRCTMYGVIRRGILDTGSNKSASVVACRIESLAQCTEYRQDTVFRLFRPTLHRTHQPLPKHDVLTFEGSKDQLFLRAEVFVERHAGDSGVFQDRVDADGMEAGLAEHLLCHGHKVVAFSSSHARSILFDLTSSLMHTKYGVCCSYQVDESFYLAASIQSPDPATKSRSERKFKMKYFIDTQSGGAM